MRQQFVAMYADVMSVMRIRTFQVLILQVLVTLGGMQSAGPCHVTMGMSSSLLLARVLGACGGCSEATR